MWNDAISETELLERLLATLRERLPAAWKVRQIGQKARSRSRGERADALIRIAGPDRRSATLVIELERALDPRDVPALEARLSRLGVGTPLVAASFLGPRTRELLREKKISYIDATGNLRIAVDDPPLFIESEGARKSPWRPKRGLASLRGAGAAQAIRALCDLRPPYGVRELAEAAGASKASVSRVGSLLEREDLVTRDDRKRFVSVDWVGIIRRWVEDYAFMESNRIRACLAPRGIQALLDRLRSWDGEYAVTGSIAATAIAPVAPPRLASIYVSSASRAAEELVLTPVDTGGNVILAMPPGPHVYDRTWAQDGVRHAALSQVAADLLTSPGRGPAEAEALLEWMAKNEDSWRA